MHARLPTVLFVLLCVSRLANAQGTAKTFLDAKELGILWRLPASRWTANAAARPSGDRLAVAEREAGGMCVSASVHRQVIPKKKDPREGRPDPLQTARDLVGCRSGVDPRPDLGRHEVYDLPGIRAAYAVAEFDMTSPPGRTLAIVLVRDPDYVWLEASGPAKLLDDATVDELIASLQVTPFAETDPRVFFEDKDLGISWKLPCKRWFGQGKAVGVRDRLATAQRGAEGMTIETWLYRRAHPATGKPDAAEESRKLCATAPREKRAFEPGKSQVFDRGRLRGAYSIGELRDATPPLRTVAVVLVREADSVWLLAWGPAKVLDDAAIADLAASLELDPVAKPGSAPPK